MLLSVSRSNFPFLCSNIPAAPAYGVYISQLICYSRACCRYGGCLIRNRRCLLYRCTWPRSWVLFGSVLLRHVYFGSCVVLVCCLCLYLCFQCCDCLQTILCDWGRQTKSNQIQKQTGEIFMRGLANLITWELLAGIWILSSIGMMPTDIK
jgi:hypothetical protein